MGFEGSEFGRSRNRERAKEISELKKEFIEKMFDEILENTEVKTKNHEVSEEDAPTRWQIRKMIQEIESKSEQPATEMELISEMIDEVDKELNGKKRVRT